jgi:hypothetical protein
MIQYSTIYTYNNVIDAASKDRGQLIKYQQR